jgi:hypothetical protein
MLIIYEQRSAHKVELSKKEKGLNECQEMLQKWHVATNIFVENIVVDGLLVVAVVRYVVPKRRPDISCPKCRSTQTEKRHSEPGN